MLTVIQTQKIQNNADSYPNTSKVQNNTVYLDEIQHANFRVNPLCEATGLLWG